MAALKLVSFLLVCMLVAAPMATQAAFSCSSVNTLLAPCLTYLRAGGKPTTSCCSGVSTLNASAKTTPDRQAACQCLKNSAASIPDIKPNFAAALPGQCGVSIPYKISKDTDCNKVK